MGWIKKKTEKVSGRVSDFLYWVLWKVWVSCKSFPLW